MNWNYNEQNLDSYLDRSTLINIGSISVSIFLKYASEQHLSMLSPQEQSIWLKDKQYRRNRLDWLSGRIAAKSLIHELSYSGLALKDIYINNDVNGVPISNVSKLPFSISHNSGLGLCSAISFDGSIGCDLQKIRTLIPSFQNLFVTREEVILWAICSNSAQLHTKHAILWAIKESAFKCLSSSNIIPESFRDIITAPDLNNRYLYKYNYQNFHGEGRWVIINNFVIALSVIY
ncbi:4'-phosphopantetheinyl transferase family protein [Paenibacillus harenae]|uniref:Phosphopantetheinyl transferase n=1 Tax=Paenibacillus harenae TaxID=306543 RepID=A0ABT9U8B2_PAEHA|nr:4'-phosphopantetheinyl transferase family protein [Paenibacillus harenae]MDQ0114955.1 phosphopantetheinyl transferase [Paenibacillus harenae]